jgi:hypothetical protein
MNAGPPWCLRLLLLLVAVSPAGAAELVGKVVGITDGDTLTLLVGRREVKVRLAKIDTPERMPPWEWRRRAIISPSSAAGRGLKSQQFPHGLDTYALLGSVWMPTAITA